jgi:hypothetical protein
MKTIWYYIQFLLLPVVFVVAVLQGVMQAFYTTMDALEEHINSRHRESRDRVEQYSIARRRAIQAIIYIFGDKE